MPDQPKFYITVAIDYANSAPHLGHAYEKIAADVIARYKRLRGYDVFYLMGNDEHSTNVEKRAQSLGQAPKEYCDAMYGIFKHAWDVLGISYTEFMQTSGERHHLAVRELIRRIHDHGYVYRGVYRGWYCVSCEAFYTAKELIDGVCPVHKRPAEQIEEQNYFFRLSAFQGELERLLAEDPDFCRPETRRNEVLNIVRAGLDDISISRARSRWGIPVPFGDEEEMIYVWFDALSSYISGIGFATEPSRFDRYWPADVHLIGKDITRFHSIVWPAMLMAAGLPVPRTVFGHGFLTLKGEKFSKTTGNVIDPVEFAQEYGVDQLRWYLLSEVPFGQDGNFSVEAFIKRVNSDLANDLGNLLSRTTAMIERFAAARIPEPRPEADDGELARAAGEAVARYAQAMDRFELHEGAAAVLRLVRRANKYIDEVAPWDLARDVGSAGRLATVLWSLAEVLRVVSILTAPFFVHASGEIGRQLGLRGDPHDTSWEDTRWGRIAPGTPIARGAALFPRIETSGAEVQGAAPETMTTPPTPSPLPASGVDGDVGELVSLDAFRALDLRVGVVRKADRIEGADKLLRLEVDLGKAFGVRQVVAGVAQHYPAENLVGRRVIVVANLKPAKLRGVLSEGMILAASQGDRLVLVGPWDEIDPGAVVR